MKKSLIKKLALVTGAAVAFSSFALMSTGCSEKKDKKDKKDKDDEKIEETEEPEETEAETVAETTEETEEIVEETIEETFDITEETDIDISDLFDFDLDAFEDEEVKALAAEYMDKNYMLFTLEDMGEDLPDGAIEGFMGMSDGSLSIDTSTDSASADMGIVEVIKFEDKASAMDFFTEDMAGMEFTMEQTDAGDVFTAEEDGAVMVATITDTGILYIDAVMSY